MDGLILFSHGSVLCGAAQTLYEHAERLRTQNQFAAVEVAFLNYSVPTLEEAAEKLARSGIERVIIAPYFLVPGKFVTVELPRHIEAIQRERPSMRFTIAEPIGYDPSLADAILELAADAKPDGWREDFLHASAYCEADPQCPLYATPRCPKVPGPVALESVS